MASPDFEIPEVGAIAVAALDQLRSYGSHVVFHGRDGSLSLAASEREALEIADPDREDSYFSILELISALSHRD
jgi:hypothetical protein